MSGRRNKQKAKGKHTQSSDNPLSQPPPAEDDTYKLTDEAAKCVEGLVGYDLTKRLHDHARDLFEQGDVTSNFVSEHTKEALQLMADFKCPRSIPLGTPIMLIPYLARRTVDAMDHTKRGRVNFGCPLTVGDLGKRAVEIADRVLNKPSENGPLLLQALTNVDLIKQPYVDIQGLEQIVVVGASAQELMMVSFLVQRLVPDGIDVVTVKPSPLHGNGVFAKRNIKKGDLVTMYPCDAFSYCTKNKQKLWAKANGDPMIRTEAELLFGYSAQIEPTQIAIAADPDKYSNDACGHLINDGACLLKKDCGVDDVLKYVKESTDAQNCHFIPLAGIMLAVVASRDIKKGDEVLTAYGAGFWVKFGV